MTKEEIDKLLYEVPDGVDYADLLEEVDLEDVPKDTIEKLKELMNQDDDYLRHKASRLLTIWGLEDGFNIFTQMFKMGQLADYYPHRLYGYDDTNRIVLDDLVSYWASKAGIGKGEEAREEIFPYVKKIIDEASSGEYSIQRLSFLVRGESRINKEVFKEYIPYLKHFLFVIMDKPENNYWRIHDTLSLFLEIEPAYVKEILAIKGQTLADYGIEEQDAGN